MDEFDDQIYEFGSSAYDTLLSAQLDEGFVNDFNDDTFGDTATTRDFDFAGNTNRFLSATPAPSTRTPSRAYNPLDHDDLLSSNRPSPPVHRRTVEEIELSQRQQAAQRQPPPPMRATMTLEQVEAEMLRSRQEQQFQMAQMQQQRGPPPIFYAPSTASGPSTPQQQSQQIPSRFQPHPSQQSTPVLQQALPPPNNMMATLFPPLPSQQAPPPTVEQQLEYLSMNQNQHPSLTGAHLQSLLHQAHNHAQLEPVAGEDLIRSVEARIREHEMLEHKRKRKAAKIASMAQYNNLMSNSDKDFITRIQVSQLVTDDPYADDFYFHIMAAIKYSRQKAILDAEMLNQGGMENSGNSLNSAGNPLGNGGKNLRTGERKMTRRENAMNKMAQNVQRLVDSANKRNKATQLSLDGALGKIALRTRSAPRQLLQVSTSTGHTQLAGLITSNATQAQGNQRKEPLTHRAVLIALEQIYDNVLDLEQLKRVQSNLLGAQRMAEENDLDEEQKAGAKAALEDWDVQYSDLCAKLWKSLRVMEPLDTSTHPFISLISVLKGKRILPRALRHTSPEQTLTLLTLIVATFDTLDVVVDSPILDEPDNPNNPIESKQKKNLIKNKIEVFMNCFISTVLSVIGTANLRMVTGMLGLLLERNDIVKVAKSKVGIAFLTIFLSRAESLKQATPAPEPQDLSQWTNSFAHLFQSLSPDFPGLFPSTRQTLSLPFGASYYLAAAVDSQINKSEIDLEDEPIWRFFGALAVCADPNEQQLLVGNVKDKVFEFTTFTKKSWITEEIIQLKIRNVNLLLHALGLDASDLRTA